MAIQATASKGGLTVENAYIMVTSARIEKYMRPNVDDQGNFTGNTEVTQASARLSLYANEADRQANFNGQLFVFSVAFDHVDGEDIVAEAYAAFKAQTDQTTGWTFTNMVDV